jgi:hypothetical protein
MAMKVLPATRVGALGLGLIVAFAVLFLLKVALSIRLPSFAIFGIGIVAVAADVIATVRRDLSWTLTVFGGLIAIFILLFAGGELLFPH